MARSPAMAPTTLGGGATTYDVSPPAATTEATAAGVALANKTFSSFTGADAGSIDGYTARTVNAAGATSWSGTGLGAYTPSGGADGDAGVLALDATIGGVVVATALHDYTRAAAGSSSLETLVTWDFTTADTAVLSTGANTITTDTGGTDVVAVNVYTQTSSVVSESYDVTNGTGLEVSRADGDSIGGIAFSLTDVLAACDVTRDTLIASVRMVSVSGTGETSQFFIWSLTDQGSSISNSPTRGMMAIVKGASNVDTEVREFTTGATTAKVADMGTTFDASGFAIVEVMNNAVRAGWSSAGTLPARSSMTLGGAGSGSESVAVPPPSPAWTWFTMAQNPKSGGTMAFTIESITWYRTVPGAS